MKRNKKFFLIISLLFLLLLAWIVWDFSRRSEFRRPAQPQEEQRVTN
ncbi:hypothetical protein [Cesiribacter andamanensis]|uniref:Uncharacterized protein n=1 Tax=Cesiribacter andamanensis AMV16 TaxID=1279009 RepID=M7N2D4_9BACT|nr:hypothetical protein [Cesiribacter andamanensis]EMR01371.1 hypothetical protein ADICEAN_03504 [Cesiribacter andamanensis AMV16]